MQFLIRICRTPVAEHRAGRRYLYPENGCDSWRSVVETDVSVKYVSIFGRERRGNIFLRNIGIYLLAYVEL
jgi:hypothetical protein